MAKSSRRARLKNMNEVYFKDKGTWLLFHFASSPKGRTCNLRRTMNLERKVEQRAGGSFLNFSAALSFFSCSFPIWSASSHAASRASIIIPSLGLSGHYKSLLPHLLCMVTLFCFYCRHDGRRQGARKARCSITVWCCCSCCSSVSSEVLTLCIRIVG